MPTDIYLLNTKIPHKLEIRWSGSEFNPHALTATLDGTLLATVATRQELRAGQEFPLPDQSILRIQYLWPIMFVYHKQKPLVSPASRLRNGYASLLVSAFLTAVLSQNGQMGSVYLYLAALFVILAAFTYRRYLAGPIAGVVLYLMTLLVAYGTGNELFMENLELLIFTFLLPIAMLGGLKGIQELKKLERCS